MTESDSASASTPAADLHDSPATTDERRATGRVARTRAKRGTLGYRDDAGRGHDALETILAQSESPNWFPSATTAWRPPPGTTTEVPARLWPATCAPSPTAVSWCSSAVRPTGDRPPILRNLYVRYTYDLR